MDNKVIGMIIGVICIIVFIGSKLVRRKIMAEANMGENKHD